MTTLLDFIEQRLAEDEQVARRAFGSQPLWHYVSWVDGISGPAASLVVNDRHVDVGVGDDDALRPDEAEHIARHDPARVLLQVTAIEAILAHRQRLVDAGDTDAGGQPLRLDQLRERQAVLRHLDAVLEMLAVFWASHPDYRDDWGLS